MFDNLGYLTRVDYGVLNILRGGVTMTKGFKICDLYISDGAIVIGMS